MIPFLQYANRALRRNLTAYGARGGNNEYDSKTIIAEDGGTARERANLLGFDACDRAR
jgi:hypothetical protein